MQEIRRENLRQIVKEYGSQAELGRRFRINPTHVSQILTKKRSIGEKAARSIERKLRIAPLSLDAPLDQASGVKEPNGEYHIGNETDVQITSEVALISSKEAVKLVELYQFPPEKGRDDMVRTTVGVGVRAFALRVEDDSMNAPAGMSIPMGYHVIVDPDVDHKNGDIVAAVLPGQAQVIVKKLVIDGPNRYLRPLNPTYSPIPIDDECQIIGPALEIGLQIRRT